MLQWFRKQESSHAEVNGNGNDMHIALMQKMVEFLEGQISAPKRATSVLSHVSRFKELPPSFQEKELPALYLKLEQYLCDEDPMQKFTRLALRKTVQYRYEPLMELENFNLIFEEKAAQEFLLCQMLLKQFIAKSQVHFKNSDTTYFHNISEWVHTIPQSGAKEIPFEAAETHPATFDEWTPVLTRFSQRFYQFLVEKLGKDIADELYENSYRELGESYRLLETFHVIVQLLPESLLDESKIGFLNSDQVKNVFLNKINQLQKINEALNQKNTELQSAQDDLEAAQESTLESVELLNLVLNTVDEGVIATDENGKIIMINEQALDMFGYTEDDLIKKDFTVLLPEKYREQHRLAADSVEKTGLSKAFGERLTVEGLRKDRSVFALELEFNRTDIGKKSFFTVALEDLSQELKHETEYKKALSNLRAIKDSYRHLMDVVPEIVFTLSVDGDFVSINPSFEQICGWDREEWLGKPFTQLVHPEDSKITLKAFQNVLQNQETRLDALRLRNSDDVYISGKFRITPQLLDGKVSGAICLLQIAEAPAAVEVAENNPQLVAELDDQKEITRSLELAIQEKDEKLEQLDADLHLAENRFRKMMSLSNVGMGIHTNGRLAIINEAGAAMLGADSPADLTDKHMMDFIAPEDRERFQDIIFNMLKTGDDAPKTQLKMQTVDERNIDVVYQATPVVYNGSQAIQFTVEAEAAFEIDTPESAVSPTEKWDAYLQYSPDAVMINALDGQVLKMNSRAESLLGESADALSGSSFMNQISDEERDAASQNIYLMMHGRMETITVTLVNSEGIEQSVQLLAKRIQFGEDGAMLLHLRPAVAAAEPADDSEKESETLKTQISELEQKLAETTGKISEYESQITAQAELANEERQSQIKILEQNLEETHQNYQDVQAKLTAALADVQTKESQLMETQNHASEMESRVQELLQNSEEMASRLQSLNNEYKETQAKLEEARATLTANQQTDRQIKTNAAMMQAKLQNTQMKLNALLSEYSELSEKHSVIKSEYTEYNEKAETAQRLHEKLLQRIEAAREERDKLEQMLAESRVAYETASGKLSSLEANVSSKTEEASRISEELYSTRQSLETTKSELASLSERKTETQTIVDALAEKLRETESALSNLELHLQDKKEERDTLEQQVASLSGETKHLKNQLEELTTQTEEKSARLQTLQNRVEETETNLQDLVAREVEAANKLTATRRDVENTDNQIQSAIAKLAELNEKVAAATADRDSLVHELNTARADLEATRAEQQQIEHAFNAKHGSMQELESRLNEMNELLGKEKARVQKLRELFPIGPGKQIREDNDYWQKVWAFAEDPDNESLF